MVGVKILSVSIILRGSVVIVGLFMFVIVRIMFVGGLRIECSEGA